MRFFRTVWILSAGIAFIVLFGWNLSSLPGLHGDEAWVISRVHDIAAGLRPVYGMNSYTGPLHQYLAWPFLLLFGYSAFSLRVLSLLLNLGALAILFQLLFSISRNRKFALTVVFILATTPMFLVFSRFGWELTALCPLLLILGISAYETGWKAQGRASFAFGALSGLSFALLVYTHLLTICFVFAAVLSTYFTFRKEFLVSRASHSALAVFAVTFSSLFFLRHANVETASNLRFPQYGFLADLPNLPLVLIEILDGGLLYENIAGERFLSVFPYMSIMLIAMFLLRFLLLSRRAFDSFDRFLLCTIPLSFLFLSIVVPHYALRYFLLPLFALVILVVKMGFDSYACTASRWLRRALPVSAGMVIFLNLLYFSTNFLFALERSGGRPHSFEIGNRLTEDSMHFFNTSVLYDELRTRHIKNVFTNYFIASSLSVDDLENAAIDLTILQGPISLAAPASVLAQTALIDWNGSVEELATDFLTLRETGNERPLVFVPINDFDSHFVLSVPARPR